DLSLAVGTGNCRVDHGDSPGDLALRQSYSSIAETTTSKGTPSDSKYFWPPRTMPASFVRSLKKSFVAFGSRTRKMACPSCFGIAQSGLKVPSGLSILNQSGNFTNILMPFAASSSLANSRSTSDSYMTYVCKEWFTCKAVR